MIVAVAVAPPPCATLAVVGAESEKLCAVLLNVAVMIGADVTTSVHVVLVPLHPPPDHPAKALAAPGAAVNVTLVPGANVALHAPPQLIPAGLDVTVPVPAPASNIFTCGWTTEMGSPTPARADSAPGPATLMTMTSCCGVAVAVAVTVRVLESVLPLSTGGLNDAVTPLGVKESVSVNAGVKLSRVTFTVAVAVAPWNTMSVVGVTDTLTLPFSPASVPPPLHAATRHENRKGTTRRRDGLLSIMEPRGGRASMIVNGGQTVARNGRRVKESRWFARPEPVARSSGVTLKRVRCSGDGDPGSHALRFIRGPRDTAT